MSTINSPGAIQIKQALLDFIVDEALPGTGITAAQFWSSLTEILNDLVPRNRQMLERRAELQSQLDEWHRNNPGDIDPTAYTNFLTEIGYIVAAVDDFSVKVDCVDAEIACVAGPQLVVPINNARFALNAANARWGSLYDALYGTDAISEADGAQKDGDFNPVRGQRVVAYANEFLDQSVPLAHGQYSEVSAFSVVDQALHITLTSGSEIGLRDASQCVGYLGDADSPTAVLLCHHGLHIELQFDGESLIAQACASGMSDVVLESALSTIQDCEDSVAAVDAEDKVLVYRNWLGLMKGDLQESFVKNGRQIVRKLNPDRVFQGIAGGSVTLPGRSLLLVRNVGAHILSDIVLDTRGESVPETIIDAMVTGLCALHDLKKNASESRNSRAGSLYIVKPKQHGPEEVALSVELFARVEAALGMQSNTIKIGIMDEERRTTINLKACIKAARNRVIFINTGFLDRTGDEIHTSMHAGPMVPKGEIKQSTWLQAYEDNNVDVGLACGLQHRGQIGKGMWAIPDQMNAMLKLKGGHLRAGANTAWVPSPTAATLHATHYHQVDVGKLQNELATRPAASQADMLTIPLIDSGRNLSAEQIQQELDNNAQGILGYVVRWINQGVGCSKVLDIADVGLMEDRATLRISSQFLANWLFHELISVKQIRDTMERMALVVDQQNRGDADYTPMAPEFDSSIAFQAAVELVLSGREQPNGYTEFILTQRRHERKAQLATNAV